MVHFYLQQQGIIKMFLLYNIPGKHGKVPLFFVYEEDASKMSQNIIYY
jgi:hypothetical protein